MTAPRDLHSTRDRLLRAGLELIASRGYHATKISDIVRHCGLSQAAFYWYFPSKLELILELLGKGRATMLETLQRGYREHIPSAQDMVDNSQGWVTDLLRFAQSNREFMAILLARGHGVDPQIDDAIGATREALYEALRQNIERAVQLGMLKPCQPDLRAAFVHRLIEGSIEWWLFGHDYDLDHHTHVSAETLAAHLVHFEFFGLSALPPFSADEPLPGTATETGVALRQLTREP